MPSGTYNRIYFNWFTLIGYATTNTQMTAASSEIIIYVSISILHKT
ncbi:protein of unknown function [Candidatus Nitrosocosmicus franklandus]|uniref:Uncharacterized protein n=1 Tax=Candidatus Nitrosocosmicus franklandianus TaxID=1798806 RepID=A0A484IGP2_9ARCH|nr:protein of unknown function [Candidatus Nitrosocosmicus franklandus]